MADIQVAVEVKMQFRQLRNFCKFREFREAILHRKEPKKTTIATIIGIVGGNNANPRTNPQVVSGV